MILNFGARRLRKQQLEGLARIEIRRRQLTNTSSSSTKSSSSHYHPSSTAIAAAGCATALSSSLLYFTNDSSSNENELSMRQNIIISDRSILATSSDEESSSSDDSPDPPKNIFEGEPDYSILPEVDEPTHCSICKINRQGPCRNPWRWFEKCMKETSSENETEEKEMVNICSKPSFTWFQCVEENRPTYAFYTNMQFKEELDMLEMRFKDSENDENTQMLKFPANNNDSENDVDNDLVPMLDLTQWDQVKHTFADEESNKEEKGETPPTVAKIIETEKEVQSDSSQTSVDPDKQIEAPKVLIPALAKFKLSSSNNLPIELAYIRDQDGNILGFDYFSHEKKKGEEYGDMTFYIMVPDDNGEGCSQQGISKTTSLTAYAWYKQKTDEKEVESNDGKEKNNTSGDDGSKSVDKKEVKESPTMERLYHISMKL